MCAAAIRDGDTAVLEPLGDPRVAVGADTIPKRWLTTVCLMTWKYSIDLPERAFIRPVFGSRVEAPQLP
jgi:hypothetical protein